MARLITEHLNPRFGYFYSVSESLHRTRTQYQDLEVIQTPEFGRVLLLDGVTQVAEKGDWLYHEPMVHPALCAHPEPRSVLVIGAGDGGIVREVLRHDVERVVHAELDGGVVEACREHLPEISDGCWDDPRVELRICDGRAYVEESDELFDIVIMDMTDPFGPSTMLYTHEFFSAVKRRLRDQRGLFVMHAESTITRPRVFQQIVSTLSSVWGDVALLHLYIKMYATEWSIAIAGDNDSVRSTDAAELQRRLDQRGIGGLEVYTPAIHHSIQVEYPYVRRLRENATELPVVTDAHPTFVDEIDLNRTPDLTIKQH